MDTDKRNHARIMAMRIGAGVCGLVAAGLLFGDGAYYFGSVAIELAGLLAIASVLLLVFANRALEEKDGDTAASQRAASAFGMVGCLVGAAVLLVMCWFSALVIATGGL